MQQAERRVQVSTMLDNLRGLTVVQPHRRLLKHGVVTLVSGLGAEHNGTLCTLLLFNDILLLCFGKPDGRLALEVSTSWISISSTESIACNGLQLSMDLATAQLSDMGIDAQISLQNAQVQVRRVVRTRWRMLGVWAHGRVVCRKWQANSISDSCRVLQVVLSAPSVAHQRSWCEALDAAITVALQTLIECLWPRDSAVSHWHHKFWEHGGGSRGGQLKSF
jgi:hypothetical protein